MLLDIPPWAKSPRQIIIETYVVVKSVPETAKRLGYKSPSYVRHVVKMYHNYIRQSYTPEPQALVVHP